jgi:hypothetical protein
MKRRKLPSIKESENIPIDLEPSLFGGFNYSNGNPADFTLNDIISINKLYHKGVYDTLELADKFDLEERLKNFENCKDISIKVMDIFEAYGYYVPIELFRKHVLFGY